ncbi:hypothetical protein Syn6312_1852 [Synechococcus sp. PCC 6312]|nr:hypothetical protein Syn6312_1852 [Synechococcus sp. PCC 6312]
MKLSQGVMLVLLGLAWGWLGDLRVAGEENGLPVAVGARVTKDLARQLKVSPQRLKILAATPQTWPDTCLGIPKATPQACSPLLVVGWRVSVSDGQKQWFYRTNDSGQLIVLENLQSPVPLLPQAIANGILERTAQDFNQAPNTLMITAASPKIWSDGCLGLGGLNLLCAEKLTPGWEVAVQSRLETIPQRWLYRTNQAGTVIVWDAAGSQVIGQLVQPPSKIDPTDLPPELSDGQLFRMISSGGISARQTVTWLLADGQIVQESRDPQGRTETKPLRQISPEQVALWQELLRQRRFNRFNTYKFPPQPEAQAFMTIFLSNSQSTTEFTDIDQYKLPSDLLAILKAWEKLVSQGRLPASVLPDARLPNPASR